MRPVFDGLSKQALLRGLVYITLGLLLVLFPQPVIQVIVFVLAGYVLVLGAINIASFFRFRRQAVLGFEMVSGLLMALLGVLMMIFNKQVAITLPLFLGILLIIGGVSGLVQAVNYGQLLGAQNPFLIILAILIIVGGVLVILNPFGSAVLLLRIFGLITVGLGIGEFVTYFTYRGIGKGGNFRF